jgi:hypothetical protein
MGKVQLTMAIMLLLLSAAHNAGARGDRQMANFRAAESAARSGATGSSSASQQWSADPKHGWVQADEHQGAKNQSPRSKTIIDYKGQKFGAKNKKF